MSSQTEEFKKKRANYVEQYKNDPILSTKIPEIARKLYYSEFGITINDATNTIPITFIHTWKEILKLVQKEASDQFSIDIAGISLEYVTEQSESDKCRNIVPQMFHLKAPVFSKKEHQVVSGTDFKQDLLTKYNEWRTVNLSETCDKVERDVFAYLIKEFGIDLVDSASVFPVIAAVYAAGIQVAKETKQTINMYNIFEIDVCEGDKILLTPLSTVKQFLKNDSKY